MSKKKHHINLDYKQSFIDIDKIDPSPFQVRKYFDQDKLKELGESIQREGLIEPIVVRRKGSRYEIIAGERRFRAVRDYTNLKTIPALIIKADDLEARRISAAENVIVHRNKIFDRIDMINRMCRGTWIAQDFMWRCLVKKISSLILFTKHLHICPDTCVSGYPAFGGLVRLRRKVLNYLQILKIL